MLNLKFNLKFEDLYSRLGLVKLQQEFEKYAEDENSDIISRARVLEEFLVELFDIKAENQQLKQLHKDLEEIYFVKKEFCQRIVAKKFKEAPAGLEGSKILQELEIDYLDIDDLEIKLANQIAPLIRDKKTEELEIYLLYAAWAMFCVDGIKFHREGSLFILPKKVDFNDLVGEVTPRNRDGFDLTDYGFSLNKTLAEANYCIFCHKQEKDSCRNGYFEKSGEVKKDPCGIELKGCPLDEKISEMNLLKSQGFSIGSLAAAIIDNPMIAGTGHRICNDCMKSCIFQKQDPVDIPQVETRVLKDVLLLPYGFEIYSLLTRWNPLSKDILPKEESGKNILVCGLGPAGYTLSHYLINEGHNVVAIDGLKIEPLHPEISGIDEKNNLVKFKPIEYIDEIYEPLSTRIIGGFGGVAEYGITSRWDKNFLKVIRLLLERRDNFAMFGGMRFGSSIDLMSAISEYNFDHVAICIGAGAPKIIDLKNNFAKGIRQASDFLMALQLTGAFKENLFTNLQIRMPIAVIGGGLTAVDSACEAGAYYVEQIKKFAKRLNEIGKENFYSGLNEEEKLIADEYLDHYELFLNSKNNYEFLKKLGGVKILYRKTIQQSPAYRLNHQELKKALEEGIEFVENIQPQEAILDEFGAISALKCQEQEFECKSLLIAAGTKPNLSPFLEDNIDINSDKISFYGDVNPEFEGNVVKAMASAKLGYENINKAVGSSTQLHKPAEEFWQKIINDFSVTINHVDRLSENVVEIFIKAPLLAKKTQIGQIFRLQNYHSYAPEINNQLLAMEGVSLTALSIDKEKGIISGIIVETGGSTSLIQNFQENEPCIFMGPSGKPTKISQNETVLLIGGGRGNQPLTALSKVFKENNCEVIFIAGYRDSSYIVRQEIMENSCDEMIFAIEKGEINNKNQIQGNVIDAIKEYFTNNDKKIDRILTIGNDDMMHEIAKLRHQNIVPAITNAKIAITSLNAPMQCMLKGVCSQCLQKRKNDVGEDEYFYSCANQDQNMDKFNFEHLHNRCDQNSLAEKMSRSWLKKIITFM